MTNTRLPQAAPPLPAGDQTRPCSSPAASAPPAAPPVPTPAQRSPPALPCRPTPPPPPPPPGPETVVALHAYAAQRSADLAFASGDAIVVTTKKPNGWWIGFRVADPDTTGEFPSNYVAPSPGS